MPIRNDLQLIPSIIEEFELAAYSRYNEGSNMILESRHRYIGAFVLGYSAEMFLKCSVFRYRGMKSEDPIRDCFSDIERYHKRNVIGEIPPHENFHSLRY